MELGVEKVREGFAALTLREQILVLSTAGLVVVMGLVGAGWGISSAIGRAEQRLKSKAQALEDVLSLEGEYRTKQDAQKERLQRLSGSQVRLVKLVEDAAKESGIEIGQLRPEDTEPNPEGIITSRVDLRAQNLSVDRLKDFLERLENAPGIVIVDRLKIDRPYKKDTLNIDVTVTTYRMKT